jgi:hypothetical protein
VALESKAKVQSKKEKGSFCLFTFLRQDPIEEQVVKPQFMEPGPVTMETLQLPNTASSGRNGTCVTSGLT